MKSRVRRHAAAPAWHAPLAVLLLCFASAVPSATGTATGSDEARREAELRQLRERISELDRALAGDRRSQDALRREIESAEVDTTTATRRVRQSSSQVEKQTREVARAQQAREQAESQVEARRADLARALRAHYMAGSPGRVQLLFRLDEAAALDRLDVDAGAIARALQKRLADLHATIEQLRVAQTVLEEERQALEQQSQESREALAALKAGQQQRRERLEELARRGTDRATELAQARAEQARVQKLLDELRRALRDSPMKFERGTPFKAQKGRLPWPLKGPLLARYGSAKGDGPLTWSGWWIAGETGAAVRAVADGRAVYVGRMQRYGLMVILDHPGQYLSLYAHLQDTEVEVGEIVSAGTRIAAAGASGGHDRSGVYFEIREGTNAVDPRPWLVP
ncbi:MAG: murein hydrolase activator EnvC family protein [Panacagrimonas sp.]